MPDAPSARHPISPVLGLLRASHWLKNVAVLVALPFGIVLQGLACIPTLLLAALAFCLASSAVYAINDSHDYVRDRAHPRKCSRPVARGAISPRAAMIIGAILMIAALGLSIIVRQPLFIGLLVGYFGLMLLYTFVLKHQPILDVITIAGGFVIRAAAGAAAIDIFISPWLLICTFMFSLFIGFGKRRSELALLETRDAAEHRPNLMQYNAALLTQLLGTSAGAALITYLLYIMDRQIDTVFDKQPLLYTLPLVAYGLFRYAMLIELSKEGDAIRTLFKDKTLMAVAVLWVLVTAVIILRDPLQQWLTG